MPHFAPSWHDYYITNEDCYIKNDDQNVYKSTDNNLDYIDHFVVTFIHVTELNPTYYAGIMLDALNNLLCSKY